MSIKLPMHPFIQTLHSIIHPVITIIVPLDD